MSKIEKILIIGGDGMAGNVISLYLSELGYDVFVTTRRKKTLSKKRLFFDSMEDMCALDTIIKKINPKFVINCIGILNKSAEENKLRAVTINSLLPHYVDKLSIKEKYKFIHISTDCVFSGEKGNYVENDSQDAVSFYGKSKALGEVINDRNLTLRTSIIGPDTNEGGIGLFSWFMKQDGEIDGFSNALWSGVTTIELAKAIEKSFSMNISGLYHLVNNNTINKFELLKLFKKYFNKNILINEERKYICDKSLRNTRKDYNFDIPSYDVMIEEMNEWMQKHKDIYRIKS